MCIYWGERIEKIKDEVLGPKTDFVGESDGGFAFGTSFVPFARALWPLRCCFEGLLRSFDQWL
jgi:hypothetical protein